MENLHQILLHVKLLFFDVCFFYSSFRSIVVKQGRENVIFHICIHLMFRIYKTFSYPLVWKIDTNTHTHMIHFGWTKKKKKNTQNNFSKLKCKCTRHPRVLSRKFYKILLNISNIYDEMASKSVRIAMNKYWIEFYMRKKKKLLQIVRFQLMGTQRKQVHAI